MRIAMKWICHEPGWYVREDDKYTICKETDGWHVYDKIHDTPTNSLKGPFEKFNQAKEWVRSAK